MVPLLPTTASAVATRIHPWLRQRIHHLVVATRIHSDMSRQFGLTHKYTWAVATRIQHPLLEVTTRIYHLTAGNDIEYILGSSNKKTPPTADYSSKITPLTD